MQLLLSPSCRQLGSSQQLLFQRGNDPHIDNRDNHSNCVPLEEGGTVVGSDLDTTTTGMVATSNSNFIQTVPGNNKTYTGGGSYDALNNAVTVVSGLLWPVEHAIN